MAAANTQHETYQVATKRLMDVTHRARQRMQLRTSLARLLELALETIQDMVECEATLSRRSHVAAHAAHPGEGLLLHRWSSLRLSGAWTLRACKIECAAATIRLGREISEWWVLMLFGARGGLGVLFGEDTDDAGGDFVVDNGLVVFPDDVNTEFLVVTRDEYLMQP